MMDKYQQKSMTIESDEEERQSALQQLKTHLYKYCKADDSKAIKQLAITLCLEILAVTLNFYGYQFVGWPLHCLTSIRFFIQFHDMAHFAFFRSSRANVILGKIVGIYTFYPFEYWRDGHNHHHMHLGNLDVQDLTHTIICSVKTFQHLPKKRRYFLRFLREPAIFFFFTAPYTWFVGSVFSNYKNYGYKSSVFIEKMCSYVLYLVIFPFLGISAIKMLFSMYIGVVIGTMLFHLQHSVNMSYNETTENWNPTRASLEGSTFLRIPFLFKIFTNGIQYHHIHHLNTKIPSYFIKQCHDEFIQVEGQFKYWEYLKINEVNYGLAIKSLMNALLDESTGRYVPFHYGF